MNSKDRAFIKKFRKEIDEVKSLSRQSIEDRFNAAWLTDDTGEINDALTNLTLKDYSDKEDLENSK